MQDESLLLWNGVLRRHPSTWSTSEVAFWARAPAERHGAGEAWLGDVLEKNCIGETIVCIVV